jgi:hypothetical protein
LGEEHNKEELPDRMLAPSKVYNVSRIDLEVRHADFPKGGPAFEPPNHNTLSEPISPTFPQPKPAWSNNTGPGALNKKIETEN